jgi:EAL domain-containing protein (putative c-di-GMP-specific phosphodiesterase class I)
MRIEETPIPPARVAGNPRNVETLSRIEIETGGRFSLIGRVRAGDGLSVTRLDHEPFTIGRNTSNSLHIPDSTVSSHHAEIAGIEASPQVTDLDSTNGTFVNGKRICGTHPLQDGDLLQFGSTVFRMSSQSGTASHCTDCYDATNDAAALVQFSEVLKKQAINPHLQPIVDINSMATVGYEVLARSRYMGLRTAAALFQAAARMNAEIMLSQQARLAGMNVARMVPRGATLFLNTHPRELDDPQLVDSLKDLRANFPRRSICIEIHESAVSSPLRLKELKQALADVGMQLAFDDFGAGQSRLRELIAVRPDYVKFDMSLLDNVEDPQHARAIETLVQMTLDLEIVPLAEGVETQQQHDACRGVGFLLGQGFLYGHPMPVSLLQNPPETFENR